MPNVEAMSIKDLNAGIIKEEFSLFYYGLLMYNSASTMIDIEAYIVIKMII